jgi:hypothetical protein
VEAPRDPKFRVGGVLEFGKSLDKPLPSSIASLACTMGKDLQPVAFGILVNSAWTIEKVQRDLIAVHTIWIHVLCSLLFLSYTYS